MKYAFLDTNVLIDFLADRRPFSLDAARLFHHSISGKVKIYVSAVSYNNIYYILRQHLSYNETLRLLSELYELTEITDVTKSIIEKSLHSEFKDFEDAIQNNCAMTIGKLDFFVTRDTKDFRTSKLSILTPKEAVSLIENASR